MKIKIPFLILMLIMTVAGSQSCKSVQNDSMSSTGNTINRSMNIKDSFKGISVSGAFDVTYASDNSGTVAKMSGPEELVNATEIKVENGILKIAFKDYTKPKITGRVSVELNGRTLTSYIASATGKINVTTAVRSAEPIKVNASSSGGVKFSEDVKSDQNISIVLSSSAWAKMISTESTGLSISCSSSASASISDVICKKAELASSSSGDIKISDVKAEVVASLSSSSGADIKISEITTSTLNAVGSSGGDVTIGECVNISTTNLSASSGAMIKANGNTKTLNATASSGGEIVIKGLNCYVRNVSSSSGGKITPERTASIRRHREGWSRNNG